MKQQRLVLWHEFDGKGDTSIEVLEERCAAFSALGMGEVIPEVMNIRELIERLARIRQGGEAPDIAFVPADMLYLQEQGCFSKVNSRHFAGVMEESQWQSMQLNGQQFGVPLLGGNHLVMFYNKAIYPQPPASWEELQEQAPALQAKGITPSLPIAAMPTGLFPFSPVSRGGCSRMGRRRSIASPIAAP